jgi:hypothetical protein
MVQHNVVITITMSIAFMAARHDISMHVLCLCCRHAGDRRHHDAANGGAESAQPLPDPRRHNKHQRG